MRTIKQSVFRELSNKFGNNEFTRKDIQKAVWNAQGFKRQSRGRYELTKVGKKFATCSYEDGVALIRENNKNVLERRKAKREANRKALPPHILHADKFQHLSGLTITRVRYMTPEEMQHLAWGRSSIVFEWWSNGTYF